MAFLSRKLLFALLIVLASMPAQLPAATIYETQAEFLARAFTAPQPGPAVIWLTGERKATVSQLLGHDYPALRLRYWCREQRSAWIVDEIGKELPITVGIIVEAGYIRSLQVLTYRENRGGEVATPSFTDQFNGAVLKTDQTLSTKIDGITGATLSVQALTRLARMALYLHPQTECTNDT
jgi:hypothetical protein